MLGALAGGDLFHDGVIDVVADDNCGNVYAWNPQGRLVFHQHSNPAYSGAPLAPFQTVRQGPRDRTESGFLSSPVLAHLSGNPDSPLDIIAAGEDRHVYAWQPEQGNLAGKSLPGFPVLVDDPDKLTAVDPVTNHLTFSTTRAEPNPGIDEDQGKLVDTPAVADIDGSGKPSIIVGSNEEYLVNTGDEGGINAGNLTSTLTRGARGDGSSQLRQRPRLRDQADRRDDDRAPAASAARTRSSRAGRSRSGSSTPGCCRTSARASTARPSSRR